MWLNTYKVPPIPISVLVKVLQSMNVTVISVMLAVWWLHPGFPGRLAASRSQRVTCGQVAASVTVIMYFHGALWSICLFVQIGISQAELLPKHGKNWAKLKREKNNFPCRKIYIFIWGWHFPPHASCICLPDNQKTGEWGEDTADEIIWRCLD